jgi:hypothetical protein
MSRALSFLAGALGVTLVLAGCSTDTFGVDGGDDATPGMDAATEADASNDAITIGDGPGSGEGGFSCPFFGTPIEPSTCTSCTLGGGCCIDPDAGSASCPAAGACLGNSDLWRCFQPSDCTTGGNMYCCVTHGPKALFQCPHMLDAPATTTCSNASSGCIRLCTKEADCNGTSIATHCSEVDFGSGVQVGVCL